MPDQKEGHKLFWFTLMTLAVVSGFAFFMAQRHLPSKTNIDLTGQPTIGNPEAKVHVVVFEELKCPHCKRFTLQVFPKIKEKYIDTRQITFTAIPVSFISGSMPAAAALICVYLQDINYPNAQLFFSFLDTLYNSVTPATPETLLKMAKSASPSIDIAKLKSCMEKEEFRAQIEKNTLYGTQIMGRLITPTLYVNGMKSDDVSLQSVSKLIDAALSQTGANP